MKLRRILSLLLAALGLFTLLLSVRALLGTSEQQKVLSSAVWLEEAVVLPENEGRMVIVRGDVEMTGPAHDGELGLTLDTLKAFRYDQEYRQISSEKNLYKFNWVSRGGKTIVGEAALGEFALDAGMLTGFPAEVYYTGFDPAELNARGYTTDTQKGDSTGRLYVLENAVYYYDLHEYSLNSEQFIRTQGQSIAEERTGARAFSYSVHEPSRHEVMTLAGVQRGNTLTAHEGIGAVVMDGDLSREEVMKAQRSFLAGGAIAFALIGLVLIALGLWIFLKGLRKKKRA